MRKQLITNNNKTTNSIKLEKPSLKLIKKKYIKFKFNKSNKRKKFKTSKSKLIYMKNNYIYISYKNKCNYKVNYYYILLSILLILLSFIFTIIFRYHKKSGKKDDENKFSQYFSENKEFFINLIKEMNTNEKYKEAKECYYNHSDTCIYKYFCPKKVKGKNLKLFGILGDGAYILTDDLKDINIAYSFGIDGEFSFDLKIADQGIDVYMFDHTINGLSFDRYNIGQNKNFEHDINYYQKKLHFFKIGITGSNEHPSNMKTLEEILRDNGHLNEKNMILKMDAEGAEWEMLKGLSDDILKKFKYITLELHLTNEPKDYHYDVIKKLSKFHQVIFIRYNNAQSIIQFGNNKIGGLIEVTYMIKKGNKFIRDNSIYPEKNFYFKNVNNNPDVDFDLLNIFKLFYQK